MVYQRLFRATLAAGVLVTIAGAAVAAPCGNNSAGFEAWKRAFAAEAKADGPGREQWRP